MQLRPLMQRLGLAEKAGGPPPLPSRVAGIYLAVLLASTGLMLLGVVLSLAGVPAVVHVPLYLAGAAVLVINLVRMRRHRRAHPRG